MKDEISEMKKNISEKTSAVKDLKYLKVIISYDDMKDFEEDEKTRLRYSGI